MIQIYFHMSKIVFVLITKDAKPFDVINGLATSKTDDHFFIIVVFVHCTVTEIFMR